MRPRSLEIIDIIGDVVRCISEDKDRINYVFGNAQYVKDRLDELSLTPPENIAKFPLVALFCPFREHRDGKGYRSKARVNILIACSSRQQWSNEERREYSFERVLRPIYASLIDSLLKDRRLDFGYDGIVAHEYSENYSYGRYGAYTASGESVSEPIDAINVTNLELIVRNFNCRTI